MNIFIWRRVNDATDSYHAEGGIVVIAATLDRARELIRAECPPECEALAKNPDHSRACVDTSDEYSSGEYIAIMPDAGCC